MWRSWFQNNSVLRLNQKENNLKAPHEIGYSHPNPTHMEVDFSSLGLAITSVSCFILEMVWKVSSFSHCCVTLEDIQLRDQKCDK